MSLCLISLCSCFAEVAGDEDWNGRAETFHVPSLANAASGTNVTVAFHLSGNDGNAWMAGTGVSILAGIAGCVACTFPSLLCICLCIPGAEEEDDDDYCGPNNKIKRGVWTWLTAPSAFCSVCTKEDEQGRLMKEAFLLLHVQWWTYALARTLGHFTGSVPTYLLALVFPFVIRSIIVDHCMAAQIDEYAPVNSGLGGFGTRLCESFKGFAANVAGKLEILDAISDALAAASAYHLSHEAFFRFTLTLGSLPPWLRSLSTTLGLGGMLTAALVYSSIVFATMVSFFSTEHVFKTAYAELAGLTKTAAKFKSKDRSQSPGVQATDVAAGLAKIFGEAAWQALLQTSLIMAKGQPLFEQPVLLCSVVLSCVTLAIRTAQLTFRLFVIVCRAPGLPLKIIGQVFCFPFIALLWLILALVLAKLYYAEACEDRLWGLSTGCIDVPPQRLWDHSA